MWWRYRFGEWVVSCPFFHGKYTRANTGSYLWKYFSDNDVQYFSVCCCPQTHIISYCKEKYVYANLPNAPLWVWRPNGWHRNKQIWAQHLRFFGNKQTRKKKNRNEQQLKNTKKIRKTTVGLEQVQIIDGKEVTWFTTLNMRNTVQNKMWTIKKAI